MRNLIGAIVVGIAVLAISIWMSYVIYQPETKKAYNEKLEKVEIRGYTEGDVGAAGATNQEVVEFDFITALSAADPLDGAKKAKKCVACHSMEKDGPNKVGPSLYEILGAKKANVAGYSYSDAMRSKGGTWTYDDLFAFLSKPKKFIPGTKMAFAGLKKPNDAAKIIAYLRTLSDNPKPLPTK